MLDRPTLCGHIVTTSAILAYDRVRKSTLVPRLVTLGWEKAEDEELPRLIFWRVCRAAQKSSRIRPSVDHTYLVRIR